jgi:hypothetical protein
MCPPQLPQQHVQQRMRLPGCHAACWGWSTTRLPPGTTTRQQQPLMWRPSSMLRCFIRCGFWSGVDHHDWCQCVASWQCIFLLQVCKPQGSCRAGVSHLVSAQLHANAGSCLTSAPVCPHAFCQYPAMEGSGCCLVGGVCWEQVVFSSARTLADITDEKQLPWDYLAVLICLFLCMVGAEGAGAGHCVCRLSAAM